MWARAASSRLSLRSLRQNAAVPSREFGRYRSSSFRYPSVQRGTPFGCLSDRVDGDESKPRRIGQKSKLGSSLLKETCLGSSFPHRTSNALFVFPTVPEVTTPSALSQQQQQRQRTRVALALCVALVSEARTILESHNHTGIPQKRHFSTSDSGKSPPKKDDVPDAQRTEPDFAEYLSGTTDEENSTKGPDFTHEVPIDLEGADLPLTDHTETYKHIQRRQQYGWERAREKTAANIRRALAGNMIICAAKLAASVSSGSSSMWSEFIHSVVDCGNQSLLLLGLHDSSNVADRKHPYGYGKSVYFWALVSALGTFFLGAGISGTQAWAEIMEPSLSDITWEVWSVLGLSFTIDGYVLGKTVVGIRESMPEGSNEPFWSYVWTIRDPATMAVLLEDGAACLGVVIAIAGITAASASGMPIWDGLAGLAISGLLATMGLALVRVNHRFLLGQAVDRDITNGIEQILLSQRSIDGVHSVQSQWTGPDTFSFKAEVDFDGTYLAATLMPRYQQEFLEVRDTLDQELRVLLSWYAEDVMRTVEREVRHVEAEIRKEYPGAEFIELEPMSKDADRFAIDDGMEAQLRRIEVESLNRYLRSLYQPADESKEGSDPAPDEQSDPTKKN